MRAIGGLETVRLAWRPSGRITGRFSVHIIIMPRKAIKPAFAGGWSGRANQGDLSGGCSLRYTDS